MGKKNEATVKAEQSADAIAKDIQKVLLKHGFDSHSLTKFSIADANNSVTETVLNCPSGFHKEWICRTINNVTTCGWECVKNP